MGIDRVDRTKSVPPRMAQSTKKPSPPAKKPHDIQPGAASQLPGHVKRELRRHGPPDPAELADAVGTAVAAVQDGRPEVAVPILRWAKKIAPRSTAVREMLGIALYHVEEYGDAASHLRAYRRLTGAEDQNHVLADCLRGTGRPIEHVAELINAMRPDDVGSDRWVEGIIVLASAAADAGDLKRARREIARATRHVEDLEVSDEALRAWYVAGDLADRSGDAADAQKWFGRIAAVDELAFDVVDRLASVTQRQ